MNRVIRTTRVKAAEPRNKCLLVFGESSKLSVLLGEYEWPSFARAEGRGQQLYTSNPRAESYAAFPMKESQLFNLAQGGGKMLFNLASVLRNRKPFAGPVSPGFIFLI